MRRIRRREGERPRSGHRMARPGRDTSGTGRAETITVTLTEDVGYTTSQQASATVDADPGSAYIAAGLAEGDEITVHDPQDLFLLSLSGAKGKASKAFNADTGLWEWILVECERKAKRIRFSLTQDMQTGSPKYATADVDQYYDGQDPDPGDAGITVYDDAGLYGDAKDGASGFAFLDEISTSDHFGEYIVDTCQQLATMFYALVNEGSGVASTDGSFDVDGVVVLSPVGGQSPGSSITGVDNILRLPSLDDDEVLVFRKQGTTTYYGIPHPKRKVC